MIFIGRAIYIPSIDAKDLCICKYIRDGKKEYTLKNKLGEPNLRKFINTLEYSLDQIKLREVYGKVVRNKRFCFEHNKKQYSTTVINVTFKYSVNEYNRVSSDKYVKLGYDESALEFKDCVALKDNELVGIILGHNVENALNEEKLGNYFKFNGKQYELLKTPRKVQSTSDTRNELYQNGFIVDGVEYVRWKRSSGSSRQGKCLFIDKRLYKAMHKWEMCGLKIKDGQEIDLAGLESYISLPSSSIIDTLTLDPRHILVIDDYESVFKDNVISVEEENGQLTAREKECVIKNSIWDGQGLIDVSAMGSYSDKGMVLLRNLFFKCCCFNCNLQQWFEDHGITDISQLNGRTEATDISQIKLITTPSSIKYLKYSTLEKWRKNADSTFGIVKHDSKTQFFDGKMVCTHYQLLNTLQMNENEVRAFLQDTFEYINLLINDPAVFRNHIHYRQNDCVVGRTIENKNDIIYTFLGLNENFTKTKLYLDFVADTVRAFVNSVKLGHIWVKGNYSTLLGNPIEMLKSSINQFNGESQLGIGNIHSTNFKYGKQIIGSRSPHISMSNVWLPTNVENKEIDKYFNLSNEIVCINSIGENVLQQLSGCDFDSDTVMLTDNEHLIKAAKRNYGVFKVAVCNVSAMKKKRRYTWQEQADLDIKTGNNLIGNIINLSQELNTRIWNKLNSMPEPHLNEEIKNLYLDVCKLNIMSGLEIDKAKKEFTINNSQELLKLRKKHALISKETGKAIKPKFFASKDRNKHKGKVSFYNPIKKDYRSHLTTMDILDRLVVKFRCSQKGRINRKLTIPFSEIFDKSCYDSKKVSYNKVKTVLKLTRELSDKKKSVHSSSSLSPIEKYILLERIECDFNKTIGNMSFNNDTMIKLLMYLDEKYYAQIKKALLNLLFSYPNTSFYECLKRSKKPISIIEESDSADIYLYGIGYKYL